MKKILILGINGAGKSTLAKKIAKILNIKVFHLDSYFWKSNWTPTPKEEWKIKQISLVKENQEWIIDGNFYSTIETRYFDADTIIYLDFNRFFCLYRIFKRYLQYKNKTRPDLNVNCKERLNKNFIIWVWNFNNNIKPKIFDLMKNKSSNKKVFILKNKKEIRNFITKLKQNRL